jgi:hypothetical protein
MSRVSCLLAATLVLTAAVHAGENGLLSGFTVRLHGGLDHLANLDDLNGQIRLMNTYFGIDGTWVEDAQGQSQDNGWAPYLRMPEFANRPDMGLTIERDLLKWERSRLVAGLEFTAGAASSSNLFEFSPGTGFKASVFAKEDVDARNVMATCRYSIKDSNLPVHAHVGLGLGMATIKSAGRYIQFQTIFSDMDPDAGEYRPQHWIQADYDGSTISGRLFVGGEVELGPMNLMLDLGYDYMNFGELEGSTTQTFRGTDGTNHGIAVSGAPDTRYTFVPLISASLQRMVQNAFLAAAGLPPITTPVDLTDPELQWGAPQPIKYDLSGGYVRLSVGYHF